MTVDQYRDWYYKLHDKYEEKAFELIKRGFKKAIKKLDKLDSEVTLKSDIRKAITYDDVFNTIASVHLVIGTAQGKRVLKGIEENTLNIKANPFFNEVFAKALIDFLELLGGENIETIRKTLIDTVLQYIIDRIAGGNKTISETSRELYRDFGEETGLYKWQMMRISRTETASASNYASWKAMESQRLIVDKVWISSHDHRTRDGEQKNEFDHLAMDGMVLPKDRKFKVPNENGTIDEIMYPVDPTGEASNIINCRCTIAPRPRRDADGRLIFKKGTEVKAGFDPKQPRNEDGEWSSGGLGINAFEDSIKGNDFETVRVYNKDGEVVLTQEGNSTDVTIKDTEKVLSV